MAAPKKKPAASSNDLLIANTHTAPIMVPRKSAEGAALAPLTLQSGATTRVNREEWALCRQMPVICHYLDLGILKEVPQDEAIITSVSATSDLEAIIPENLRGVDETGTMSGEYATAKVAVTGAGAATV